MKQYMTETCISNIHILSELEQELQQCLLFGDFNRAADVLSIMEDINAELLLQ